MTDLPEPNAETYLGDGLYVSFDGWHLRLSADRFGTGHWVALEPEVYNALRDYVRRYPGLVKHFGEENGG